MPRAPGCVVKRGWVQLEMLAKHLPKLRPPLQVREHLLLSDPDTSQQRAGAQELWPGPNTHNQTNRSSTC